MTDTALIEEGRYLARYGSANGRERGYYETSISELIRLTTALTEAEAKLAMASIPLRALANEEKAYRKAHFEKVQNLARACLAELGEG
jgi:hypothetical protein